jgi:hypothetical protein
MGVAFGVIPHLHGYFRRGRCTSWMDIMACIDSLIWLFIQSDKLQSSHCVHAIGQGNSATQCTDMLSVLRTYIDHWPPFEPGRTSLASGQHLKTHDSDPTGPVRWNSDGRVKERTQDRSRTRGRRQATDEKSAKRASAGKESKPQGLSAGWSWTVTAAISLGD